MSTRVLSTEEAKAAITRMQSLIAGGLTDQVRQLDAEGQRLSDPNVWDGALATEFRSELWPQTKTALERCVTALEELRTRLQGINQNIMAAGGNV
jgi:uncharacterized protein YukE